MINSNCWIQPPIFLLPRKYQSHTHTHVLKATVWFHFIFIYSATSTKLSHASVCVELGAGPAAAVPAVTGEGERPAAPLQPQCPLLTHRGPADAAPRQAADGARCPAEQTQHEAATLVREHAVTTLTRSDPECFHWTPVDSSTDGATLFSARAETTRTLVPAWKLLLPTGNKMFNTGRKVVYSELILYWSPNNRFNVRVVSWTLFWINVNSIYSHCFTSDRF